jgi:hypothetical protein
MEALEQKRFWGDKTNGKFQVYRNMPVLSFPH